MAVAEFDLIRRYFTQRTPRNPAVQLGIGDDCALLRVPSGQQLAVTADTLVQGVHFLPDCAPGDLAYKALAVNLSDLAAMGAEAVAFTLALTLPASDEAWLEAFASGLFQLAGQYGVELCGGDTTRGPLLVLTIQAMGLVPTGQALTRSGAKPDDGIYLTGSLGDAGLGLKLATARDNIPQAGCYPSPMSDLGMLSRGRDNIPSEGRYQGRYLCYPTKASPALSRFHRPQPRLAAGLALRGLAHACIDVSDGLAADLGHILDASGVGATLDAKRLPLGPEVTDYLAATGDWRFPLSCGDDYELCFTAPGESTDVTARLVDIGCPCAYIGHIQSAPGLRLRRQGQLENLEASGYRHF